MTHYDYIIAGAGCAGLSLLMHLAASDILHSKRVLVVDRSPKTENDRTWCFWETGPGLFEPVVFRRWSQLHFHSQHAGDQLLDIQPFLYKMIRGIDFYDYCYSQLRQYENIDWTYGTIEAVSATKDAGTVTVSGNTYTADYVFNSIPQPVTKQPGKHYLLQHFKGWLIQADRDCFDTAAATLMDFRISQQHGAAFMYILPFSASKAMVEYTLFTGALLEPAAYEEMLQGYLSAYYPGIGYEVLEKETGCIPMTNHQFPVTDGRMIYIGTAGGQTKGSSGYTFRFIQERAEAIAESLAATGRPGFPQTHKRFLWYDTVLLHVLEHGTISAAIIFERLFSRNQPDKVLRFLDNTSTLPEELSIIATLPKQPFIQAAIKEWKQLLQH